MGRKMKKLFVIVVLLASFSANADQCDDLAQQASSGDMSNGQDRLNAKYAIQSMQALGCGGQQQQEQHQKPVTTEPQYVPSAGVWCQVIDGVQNCWK